MTAYTRRRIRIALIALAAFVASFFVIRSIETNLARANAETMFVDAVDDMHKELLACSDDVLFYLSRHIVSDLGSLERASQERVQELARLFGLDELNIADTNGIIRASTFPPQVGVDMKSKANGEDPDPDKSPEGFYLHLAVRGEPWYHQAPRRSYNTDGQYRKFFGVPLPSGDSYVQVGIDFERVPEEVAFRLSDVAIDWTVGENGYYVIARESDGAVISDGGAEKRDGVSAPTLAELGLDPARFPSSPNETFEAVVGGIPALCRADLVKELGLRSIVVFPLQSILRSRAASLVAFLFLAAVMILVAAGIALRHVTEQEHTDARNAAEAERRRQDLAMAATIQNTALPRVFPPFPERREIDIFALMKPAREVGGDFYDFFFVTPDRLALLIADVSGKGVPAALFMMRAKTLLRGLLATEPDLGKAVEEANRTLAEHNESETFITAWISVADLATGRLDYVNAGHNPPILRHADGTIEWLRARSGFILAGMPDSRYRAHTLALHPGDRLLLYTDGVTEATDPDLALYGEERLAQAVASAPEMPELLCAAVTADVGGFERGAAPADDLTMLCFAFHGLRRRFPAVAGALGELSAFVEAAMGDDPKWLVAADEIGANIVHYSHATIFDVAVSADRTGTRLTFSDDGTPFDPLAQKDPDITASADERKIGGLGIFVVKKMVDDMTYRREDDRNVLTLFRKRG